MSDAPAWLADFQRRFGAVLRAPLDRGSGTLRADPARYDRGALGEALDGPRAPAAERLAVYNRQYWFRLFGVMQTAYPLTARLLGHWHFNGHSAAFLLAHPPRHWDIDRAPDGFDDYLAAALADDPSHDALVESARLDAAWRALFRAPATAAFRPTAADAARLLDARLVPSPAVAVVSERWPLLELKRALAHDRGESAVALPPPLPHARWWALVRETAGIRHLALEAREGELLALLRERTVRDALAALEARCPDAERAALPADARRWLGRSVERGFWSGLEG
ncbi:MAG: hypothetical protein JWM10_3808 [Myxococcaceae bacterium]|nr:hypothetical protein [Myxococcaceae bacterium]